MAAERSRNHIRDSMQGMAFRLEASLRASASMRDSLSKGEFREEDLVNALRPHLPSRYSLGHGLVADASGAESDPQDVIILDTHVAPALAGSDRTVVVPVEGVAGVIQVKTIPTADSIRAAIANVASAKRLKPTQVRYGWPLSGADKPGMSATAATFFGGVIFLTDGTASVEALAKAAVDAALALPARERPDAVYVANLFTLLWSQPRSADQLDLCFRAEQADTAVLCKAEHDSLLLWYLCLVDHLQNWISAPIPWREYALAPKVGGSNDLSFTFSYWYDDDDPPSWVGASEP